MDSDQGKLFVGGISYETTEDRLREHFGQYGEVSQAVIMRDKITGRPRGFGFVAFVDPAVVDRVLLDKQTIDGRTVEAKRAMSREEQHTTVRTGNSGPGRTAGNGVGGGNIRTKKIFVGGLPPTLTEEGFRQYFQTYGNVMDVVVMYDQATQRPRGFGFISFDSEDAVDLVLHKTFHELNGKMVEVKRALPKDANLSGGGGRQAGGNYQSYGGPGSNTGSYDGRMDANRYMQPQAAGGGYGPYGSSGYGAPSYGYGAASSVYGGYGYGSTGAGYSGPGGGYGNPSGPHTGYMGGPPGAARSSWNNQAPSGYSSTGYGANSGYGGSGAWNAPGGGGGSTATPTGQSPGSAGYGNQGYGYGGYGGTDGSFGNQGGYGAVGGHGGGPAGNPSGGSGEQGAASGYMGGSYSDPNGNAGYSNSWRSDPSQGGYGANQVNGPPGGSASYGGPYSGAQPRQSQ